MSSGSQGGRGFDLATLLIGIALFFALKPGLNDMDRIRRVSPAVFAATVVPLVGFYDGLLGPGAGAFYMLGFVMLAGYGILKATAHTKLLNFASNLGGLLAFALVLLVVSNLLQFRAARHLEARA